MAINIGRRKMERPTPRRALSLWRGCLFAIAAGWNRGWNETGGQTTYDDQTGTKGVLQGSRAGTHIINDEGRALASGVSDDAIRWQGLTGRWAIGATQGFSAAVLTRPKNIPGASDVVVFSKRAGIANIDGGWSLGIENSSTVWECEISDGATEIQVQATTVPITTRSDMIVVTYDRQNARIFVNNRLENTVAATISVSNAEIDINLFNTDVTDTQYGGAANMAALWNRPLSRQEISMLQTDPYRMWRPARSANFLGFVQGEGFGDNDCCCPCCGGLIHFGL